MLVSVSVPAGVQAGVFASVLAAFSSTFAYSTEGTYNSQTFPLPQAAQNFDPNPSKGGGDITIVNDSALLPSSGPSGSLADVAVKGATQKNSGQISVYIVRPGDTLGAIAEMFGVSVNTIRWGNDISRSESIQPGQELTILPVTGIKYTVKSGGSLRDIIDKHGGNLEEAIEFNGLSADENLAAGTEVIIPSGELAEPKAVVKVATSRYSATPSAPRGTSAPSYAGYYLRPISGGARTQGIHGYNAVDIGASTGTPILSAASGTVLIAKHSGWNGGYGQYVVVKHANDTQTLYAHTSDVLVYAGQEVVQGQVIGYVGNTGRSTGPHLHFEIRGAKNPF